MSAYVPGRSGRCRRPAQLADQTIGDEPKERAVAFPKILLGVPLLVAGMYLPAAGAALHQLPAGAIGMGHEGYSKKSVTIHAGQTLTFENDSRWIHIIGPGQGGHLAVPDKEPVSGRLLLEQNQQYTTGTWNTPGVYSMTCSVHPEMTIKVIVKP
jgi:plastocyanin